MSRAILSVDEIIQALKRSNLPAILCEGSQDEEVFRYIESELGSTKVSFMACGGRQNLLDVFDKREEIVRKRVVFVADRDMWVFTRIPNRFKDVIFTSGYSIENDILFDSNIFNLFNSEEKTRFDNAISSATLWFSGEVRKCIDGESYKVDVNVNQIFKSQSDELSSDFLKSCNFCHPSKQDHEKVQYDYKRKLRGKTLLQLIVRYLSYPTRSSKYSKSNVIEISIKLQKNTSFGRLLRRISSKVLV